VGHLLAANSTEQTNAPAQTNHMDEPLREYFLNPSAPFPECYELHYWPYPYRAQVVVKYFSKLNISNRQKIIGHTIKFPPLGFMLTYTQSDNKQHNGQLNAPKLITQKDMEIDELSLSSLNLFQIPSGDFPEFPYDNEVVAHNRNQGYKATPHG
jgi:DNA mismatch repair ATPase MutS